MEKIVVSDTGPLISLEKLPGGFGLIKNLYDMIIIPPGIAEEISYRYNSLTSYLEKHDLEKFIEVEESEVDLNIAGIDALHEGEAQAISLAYRLKLPILIEEIDGRDVAEKAGLKVSGVAGEIFRAFAQRVLSRQKALELLQILFDKGRINTTVHNLLSQNILERA